VSNEVPVKVAIARAERILLPSFVIVLLMACSGLRTVSAVQEPATEPPQDSPKLVVLVVVDQLRADLLERYDDAFTGGFRRLMDGGMYFTRATHDHARTATAPGHTTLGTGVYPTRHGIVGNGWAEFDKQGIPREVYAVGDDDSPILGDSLLPGRSPANIYREGLASWIRAQDADSRVVALSSKDRAAIGMLAKARGEAYWLNPETGRFVTSTFYHDSYPRWIQQFNEQVMPTVFSDTIWQRRIPDALLSRARPDSSAFESQGGFSTFPHLMRNEATAPGEVGANLWRALTPTPDLAVLRLAQAALRDLELGQRGPTDFLAVSFSQTDRVGHAYGPFSVEQLDNLLRLDERLGELLESLDEEVGEGNWVLGFSADHGVLSLPEYLDPPVARMTLERQAELFGPIQAWLAEGLRGNELQTRVIEYLEEQEEVLDAIPFSEINGIQEPADSFGVLFSRSFSRERITSPLGRLGIQVRWKPGFLEVPTWTSGTTHESPYYYDRWVPLILYGAGVASGHSDGPASTVDMAPTLAGLAGIPVPDDLDGKMLVQGGG
jgi:predicted AlkP superfamily pyrophosphatase or phosphodiesterase